MTAIDPQTRRPSIADAYQDQLAPLDERYRRSLIHRLTQGYYEGWRPTRRELAALIAEDTGQHIAVDRGASYPAHPARPTALALLAPTSRGATANLDNLSGSPSPAPRGRTRARGNSATILQLIAGFEVDCGPLAPAFRFVARSLSTAGMVQRGGQQCRMVYLTYELRPVLDPPVQPPTGSVIFSAPIICFPDRLVPWADNDGRDRHHTVASDRIIGNRGPWPLAEGVQRVQFMINQQTSTAVPARHEPAGRLIVDIRSGRAAWRPT